jgi:hypothetical protein
MSSKIVAVKPVLVIQESDCWGGVAVDFGVELVHENGRRSYDIEPCSLPIWDFDYALRYVTEDAEVLGRKYGVRPDHEEVRVWCRRCAAEGG